MEIAGSVDIAFVNSRFNVKTGVAYGYRSIQVFVIIQIIPHVLNGCARQYAGGQQNQDAELINLAGRQRMLSQRISKLTLFFFYNQNVETVSPSYSLDTLKKLTDHWEVHIRSLFSKTLPGPKVR